MGNDNSTLGETAKYQITITTADGYFGAGGATNWVYIELVGEEGRKTDWVCLSEKLEISFRRGAEDVFDIEAADVGLPVLIRLGLRNHVTKDPWAVRHVNVKYGEAEAHFPVHDWVQDEMWVSNGEGKIHHKIAIPCVRSMLDQEVEKSMARLQWVTRPGPTDLGRGLPRNVKAPSVQELPLIFRPTEIWTTTFLSNALDSGIKQALQALKGKSFEFTSLESYEALLAIFENGKERSGYLDRWKSDEEFGRQQLNGISPHAFERCAKIPNVCQISHKDVAELLDGRSLEDEMKAGKIYIADYSEVYKGVTRNKNSKGEQLYCPDSVCLYYVNSSDNFVPIAIQLVPNDPQTIFTPEDSEEDWLLAKMYFKVAFGNMHEWHYHFLLTHNVMEAFAVAMFRCFPNSHPLYKLLRPHLQTVTVINTLARETLIAKHTSANNALALEGEDLARHGFKNFTMDDVVIPEIIKRKGLDGEKLLPKYYYRDDALELWNIMEDFVRDIIKFYYHSDHDVECDKHLQGFIRDVAHEGLGWEDGTTRGIPVPMKTDDQLIRLCTSVIFTSSGQHAAVNFPQYEMYKFIPNGPLAMRLPPHKKGEATLQRILDSLPDLEMSVTSIAIAAGLSKYTEDEVYIGNYPVKLFVDPGATRAIEKYKKALDKYASKVKNRNDRVDFPYVWLLPEKVPNSIAV